MQQIIFSKDITTELDRLCSESGADRIFYSPTKRQKNFAVR